MLQGGIIVKRVLVVGSGAGGAAVARELQGKFQVTVLEAGGEFRPFAFGLSPFEKIKKTGFLFDEREIQLLFPSMQARKTSDGMVMVNGIGLGGTTTLSAGNAVRVDQGLKDLGIDLDEEFEELYRDIPITYDHRDKWQETSKRLFEICEEMGLSPRQLPKFGDYSRCTGCGR
jgi:choline dehydrogenase-like flavoprotein